MIEVYYNSRTKQVCFSDDTDDVFNFHQDQIQEIKDKLNQILDMMNYEIEFSGEIK
jgi:hypothetical protein